MESSFTALTYLLRPVIISISSSAHPSRRCFNCFARRLFHSPSSSSSSESKAATSSGNSANTLMEVAQQALKHVSRAPGRVAVRADQKSYSFAQLVTAALDVFGVLSGRNKTNEVEDIKGLGSLNGARVGIVAKPSAEFVAGVFGTWLCGGVAVPLALSYPEAELLHVISDSDITKILTTPEHQEVMGSLSAKCSTSVHLLPTVTSISDVNSHSHSTIGDATSIGNLITAVDNAKTNDGGNPALILYTSGTTGKPKGVVHTHSSIVSQVQILSEAWNYTNNDQFLHCLPLHHVHGLFNALLAPLYACSVVEFMPKFSVRGVWQRWCQSYPKDGAKDNDAITVFTGVPTMYTRLLQGYESMDPDQQSASAFAANKLRLMMCGSSALPYPVMKQWEDVTGHRLLERYGMTEFVMALSNPLHGIRKGGTVGKPLPRVEVKIIMEDGTETKTGIGELSVKSPSLFKEYWKQPKVTAESFDKDGFFRTGDSVTVDEDGYFIILGRTNADIMKVGGYKLSALEIEAVLLEHNAISECSVLGLADQDYGEVVCAIIVPHEDARKRAEGESRPVISLEELTNWSKARLAPYKIPTKLFIWDTLPRNAMGKVNKKELKKLLQNQG